MLPNLERSGNRMMKYTGTCHCKAVSFTFDAELEELIVCDCSLCHKRNALMATVAREQFHITSGQDALRLYRWNSGVAQHYFCGTCGIYVYHQRRSNPAFLSVNAMCVDDFDHRALPIRHVDGKSRTVVNAPAKEGLRNALRGVLMSRSRAASQIHPALPRDAPHHPQVGQRKQRVQLRRVLRQPAVAHLHMPELALDHPERMFDLGPDARLGPLDLIQDRAHRRALVQHLAFARAHGHVPVDADLLVSSRLPTPW
jgi:hypothetical protein